MCLIFIRKFEFARACTSSSRRYKKFKLKINFHQKGRKALNNNFLNAFQFSFQLFSFVCTRRILNFFTIDEKRASVLLRRLSPYSYHEPFFVAIFLSKDFHLDGNAEEKNFILSSSLIIREIMPIEIYIDTSPWRRAHTSTHISGRLSSNFAVAHGFSVERLQLIK